MLLILLFTLVTHAVAQRVCSLNSGYVDIWGRQYPDNCAEVAFSAGHDTAPQSQWQRNAMLAVCLVERNSFRQILQCGFQQYDTVYYFETYLRGDNTDSLDLTTNNEYYDAQDGYVFFTPKDVLLAAAEACESNLVSVSSQIRACPYYSRQEFQSCLCCQGVTEQDLKNLEHCLLNTWRVVKAPQLTENIGYNCAASCPYGQKKADGTYKQYYVRNGLKVNQNSNGRDSEEDIYTFTGTVFSTILAQTSAAPTLTMSNYDTRPNNPADATPTTSIPNGDFLAATSATHTPRPTGKQGTTSKGAWSAPLPSWQFVISIIFALVW